MSDLEQVVGTAMIERLVALGMSRETMAARLPQVVITEKGAGYLVGYLSYRDADGATHWGPTVEMSQSIPQEDSQLAKQFGMAVAESVPFS